jgi:hypothetical protein
MADAGNSPLVMRAACVMGRKAAMNSRDLFRFVPAVAAIVMTVPVSAQEAAAPASAAHPAAAVVRDYLNFVLQREWNKSADLVEPKSLESLQKDYMERIKRAQTMDEEEMMFRRVGTSTMEDLVALTARDFYTAYHKGLQDRMQIDEAALERVKKSLQLNILSIAEEDPTHVHILVRTRHANDKVRIENLELISLIKTGNRWLVGLNEQMPKITTLDGKGQPVPAAAGTAPAAKPAASAPAVKPAVKPKGK